MTSAYSKTPLVKKLGIKPGYRVVIRHYPNHYFDLLYGLPTDCEFLEEDETPEPETIDFAQAFYRSAKEMTAEGGVLKAMLRKNGSLWICWPKKSSGVISDLSDGVIRKHFLDLGLVDVKVAAIDKTWSGLKFMYRVADR